MRTLLWFAVGFGIAAAGAAYLYLGLWWLVPAVVCLAASFALFATRKAVQARFAVLLLGIAIALFWMTGFDLLYLSPARKYDGRTLETRITVCDYSYETTSGVGADGKIKLDGKTYRLRFYLRGNQELLPGDVVTGQFELRFTALGGTENETYHQGKGIFLLAYPRGETIIQEGEDTSFFHFPARLRRYIKDGISEVFPDDTLAFARAVLLGDSSQLSYKEDSAYRISGVRHIIAVSGMHVSILFSAVYTMLGKRRGLTALVGIPVLILFAALAGFTPSVVRACVMQGLMLLAMLLDKEFDPPTALAAAVLVILLINPLAVTSVSFQLSVGCVAGILMLSGRISGYLLKEGRLGTGKGSGFRPWFARHLAGSLSVSLSSMTFTVPLCGIYFGTVSIVGVLANFLILWVVSFVFCGTALAVILCALWKPAAVAVAWVVSWPVRYIQLISGALSAIPAAAAYTQSIYVIIWLIFCYVLFGYMLISKKRKPARVCACMAMGLVVTLFLSWLEPRLDNGRLTVVDVGQGQCILLQGGGKTYMVDCGGDTAEGAADKASAVLLSQGISHLDGLIVTHFDEDHAGGVPFLLDRIRADCIYIPETTDETSFQHLLGEKAGSGLRYVGKRSVLEGDQYTLEMIPSTTAYSGNDSSLCILFREGNCDILITGDRTISGERELTDGEELPELEILVAGHHGAANSTGLELLRMTRPDTVVISVGKDNAYGHPAPELLERLELFRCRIYRTDLDGTIIIRW